MPHLRKLAFKDPAAIAQNDAFPFTVPAVRTLTELNLDAGVTFFVGENGSGKSTLLEAIASAAELPAIAGSDVEFDLTLQAQRRLGDALRLTWNKRTRKGFFLRAEDFFGYLKSQARIDARIAREARERVGAPPAETSPDQPGALHPDEEAAARYMHRYDGRSHGESFLELFSKRFESGGLYLLDEPETPLSPTRQLAFLALLLKSAETGAQFIIATHSPILLACPGALIYSFDQVPVAPVDFDDIEHVRVTRAFLRHPERYLRIMMGLA